MGGGVGYKGGGKPRARIHVRHCMTGACSRPNMESGERKKQALGLHSLTSVDPKAARRTPGPFPFSPAT